MRPAQAAQTEIEVCDAANSARGDFVDVFGNREKILEQARKVANFQLKNTIKMTENEKAKAFEKFGKADTECSSPFDRISRFIDRVIGGTEVSKLGNWDFLGSFDERCSA